MTGKSNKTILLVEDEHLPALINVQILEKHGFNVIHVDTGEKAVETVESTPDIDLILMDIDLGEGIDGTQAAEMIIAKHDLPLVFLSSHTEPEIVNKTKGITNYGYVVKNTGEVVLVASIEMAFKLFEAKQAVSMELEQRRRAEETLRLQALVLDQIDDRVTVTDLNGVITYVNNAELKSLGYSREELIGSSIEKYGDNPDHGAAQNEILKETLERGVWRGDVINYAADGREIVMDCRTQVVYDEDKNPVALCGVSTDVTMRKRIEKAYRESEERFRLFAELAPVGLVVIDNYQNAVYANRKFTELFGYTIEDIPSVEHWWLLAYPDEKTREKIRGEWDKLYSRASGAVTEIEPREYTVTCKGGEIRDIEFRIKSTGSLNFISFMDITERRLSEEALRIQYELSQELNICANIGEALDRVLGAVLRLNAVDCGGIYLSDTEDGSFDLIVHSGFSEEFISRVARLESQSRHATLAREGKPVYSICEKLHNSRDGICEKEGLKALAVIPVMHKGELIAIMNLASHVYDDIPESTRRVLEVIALQVGASLNHIRMIEKHLKSEEEFRLLTEYTSDVIWTSDLNFNVTYASPSVESLLGDTPEEHINRTVEDRFFPEDIKNLSSILLEELEKEKDPETEKNRSRLIETRIKRRDGSFVWLEFHIRFLRDRSGNITGLLGGTRDITERKKAEEKLRQALINSDTLREKAETLLNEKELIMKETHHRIKNNMNTIAGLLKLQSGEQDDKTVKSILEGSAGRVRSMMVLYDRLYRSEIQHELSIKEYLIPLIKEITSIVNISSVPVKTDVRIEDFTVGAKLLTPIGIIINELITNSINHAFDDNMQGLISLSISRNGGKVTMMYSDNGRGIPEHASFENSPTFGMQIIKMLVKQIRGSLFLERGEGTRFVIEFDM